MFQLDTVNDLIRMREYATCVGLSLSACPEDSFSYDKDKLFCVMLEC